MGKDSFYIGQTLHGYVNGHKQLASSVFLTKEDEKKMLVLSDLAGYEFCPGYEYCYTGYPISGNRIVLACTWYAKEMKRPGCVWTHSLIFQREDLPKIRADVTSITEMFRRPRSSEDAALYENSLSFKRAYSPKMDKIILKYLIWCIWGNEKPLVVFEEHPFQYEREWIYLFFTQNDLLKKDFSFCMGSAALRVFMGKPLELQITSENIPRGRLLIGEQAHGVKPASLISRYPMWVDKACEYLMTDQLADLKKFLDVFQKKTGSDSSFPSLIKLYIGAGFADKKATLAGIFDMISALYSNAKSLCGDVLSLYRQGLISEWIGEEDYIKSIEFILNNLWLDITQDDMDYLLRLSFEKNYQETKKLFQNIIKKDEDSKNELLLKTFASIIQISEFADFTELDYEGCSVLLSINNHFALCPELWCMNLRFQKGILRCLQCREGNLDLQIISHILNNSVYDLASELYKIYGEKCKPLFWEYLLNNIGTKKAKGMIEIVKSDIQKEVGLIRCYMQNREVLKFIIGITDSYKEEALVLRKEEVENIYRIITRGNCSKTDNEVLANFLIPFCLLEDYMVDDTTAKFSFDIVHDLLAKQALPDDIWDKMEKILPDVAYYNRWDRCKRLRKGFKKRGYKFFEDFSF